MRPACSNVALPLLVAAIAQNAAAAPPLPTAKVDGLFATWSVPTTPGCAVGIVRDGKLAYSRGFGMADLEHARPMTPRTPVHAASLAKQFTAFAIHLLVADRKISLDDDIRKFIPEVPDYGTAITVRHLLHHTSGLRDQWALLALAGWRSEDVNNDQDILALLGRQHALNFPPGEDYLYSNTGYTLLGLVVKRVSGLTLREFARQRIFEPLGMRHTQVRDDHALLVQDRALSYRREPAGHYRYLANSSSNAGATNLVTTVEDLARWDQNFYDAKLGGARVIEAMQEVGRFTDGTPFDYASGLFVTAYRGARMVTHGGADAGYRSVLLRLPEFRFSVIALCNSAEADPGADARNVVDLVLGAQLTPKLSPPAIEPAALDAFIGEYELAPGIRSSVAREGDRLMLQLFGFGPWPVRPVSASQLYQETLEALVTRAPATDEIIVTMSGRDKRWRRVTRSAPSTGDLQDFAGSYFSEELNVIYTVAVRDGNIFVRHPRGELEMAPLDSQAFVVTGAQLRGRTLVFECAQEPCNGFRFNDGRARHIQFERIAPQ
jgi:CubicO group peptidase (beta-lactamase class C family)